ncbi:hypothetical protein N8558_01525, partial [bacterium]|nr:hypothetical protein [bacterium]
NTPAELGWTPAGVRIIESKGVKSTPRPKKKRYDRFRRRTNEAPNKASAIEVGSGTGSELKTQI